MSSKIKAKLIIKLGADDLSGRAPGNHGTALRFGVNGVLYAVSAEGLTSVARVRRPLRRDHGPDHSQHHVDRDRKLQHAREDWPLLCGRNTVRLTSYFMLGEPPIRNEGDFIRDFVLR